VPVSTIAGLKTSSRPRRPTGGRHCLDDEPGEDEGAVVVAHLDLAADRQPVDEEGNRSAGRRA
jgi:hypothetical protein